MKLKSFLRNKIFIAFLIALSILLPIIVHFSQNLWLEKFCTKDNFYPSCNYKNLRLYIFPFLVFILIYCLYFFTLYFDKLKIIYINFSKKMYHFFMQPNFFILLFATLISAWCIFYFKFSFNILLPSETKWLQDGDMAQCYMGWFAFQNSPFSFPILGLSHYINYPLETSIGLTDSIPIFAIPFKLFMASGHQFYGIWLFVCYSLQAVFAALLFKNLNTHLILKCLAAFLLFFSPVLLHRYGHMSLNCHWIILAHFWLYLEKFSLKYKLNSMSLIFILTAWIHPYILLLSFTFYTFFLFSLFKDHFYNIKKIGLYFVSSLILVSISLNMIGYFHIKSVFNSGLGEFSSNLISLFNPLEARNSNLLAPISTVKDKFEAFGYLGAGILILFIAFLILKPYEIKNTFKEKKYRYLLIPIVLLTIFANLPVIRFASFELYTFPLPSFIEHIVGSFRSNGRYIWVAVYAITLFSLVKFIKLKINLNYKIFILSLLTLIQIIDIQPLFSRLAIIRQGTFALDFNFVEKVHLFAKDPVKKIKIITYPSLAGNSYYSENLFYLENWYLSGKYHYYTNIGYFSRNDFNSLKELDKDIYYKLSTSNLNTDSVYIFKDKYSEEFKISLTSNDNICIKYEKNLNICKRK